MDSSIASYDEYVFIAYAVTFSIMAAMALFYVLRARKKRKMLALWQSMHPKTHSSNTPSQS